jgi:hypothetical protein
MVPAAELIRILAVEPTHPHAQSTKEICHRTNVASTMPVGIARWPENSS